MATKSTNVEQIQEWQASVVRCIKAAKVLADAIALFDTGGPDAQTAWDAVEAARKAWKACVLRESKKWTSVSNLEDPQGELEGMEAPGPKGPKSGGGPRGIVHPPSRQLPPKSAAADEG